MRPLIFLFMVPLLVSGWRAKADGYLKAFARSTSDALTVNSFHYLLIRPPVGAGYEGVRPMDYELIFMFVEQGRTDTFNGRFL